MPRFSKLSQTYTRRVTPKKDREAVKEAPPSPLSEAREGSRCPRPHCGGLIALRSVVTLDGCCEEVYCLACARSALRRVLEPYVPIPSVRDPVLASLLIPDRPTPAAPDSEDSGGIVWPSAAHDTEALRRVCSDESLPGPPLDTR